MSSELAINPSVKRRDFLLGALLFSLSGCASQAVASRQEARGFSREEIQAMVREEAPRYGVPVALALAMAHAESNFDAGARSHKGARGVMQIMPATAMGEYGVTEELLWDPRINIRIGLHFMVLGGLAQMATQTGPFAAQRQPQRLVIADLKGPKPPSRTQVEQPRIQPRGKPLAVVLAFASCMKRDEDGEIQRRPCHRAGRRNQPCIVAPRFVAKCEGRPIEDGKSGPVQMACQNVERAHERRAFRQHAIATLILTQDDDVQPFQRRGVVRRTNEA